MAYLLADLGGTNLAMGLWDGAGTCEGQPRSVPTRANLPPEALADYWAQALCAQGPAEALLMGIPSKMEEGRLVGCDNLPTLEGAPLGDMLAARLPMPVHLFPDAVCYALGARQRYAPQARSLLAITLGTGVGAAWVLEGKPYLGNGLTGEMWKAPYAGGCLEDTLSIRGLLDRCPAPSVADLARRAAAGEAAAQAAFDAYGQALGVLLCYAVGLMDPERVLVGGGIARAHGLFGPAAAAVLAAHSLRPGLQVEYLAADDGWTPLTGAYYAFTAGAGFGRHERCTRSF